MPVTAARQHGDRRRRHRHAGRAGRHPALCRRPTCSATAPTRRKRWSQRQAEAWDPIIDWARAALGARFVLAEGVMHVEQPREAIARGRRSSAPARRTVPAGGAACDDDADRIGAAGAGRRCRRDSTPRRPGRPPMSTRTGTSSIGARTPRRRRAALPQARHAGRGRSDRGAGVGRSRYSAHPRRGNRAGEQAPRRMRAAPLPAAASPS